MSDLPSTSFFSSTAEATVNMEHEASIVIDMVNKATISFQDNFYNATLARIIDNTTQAVLVISIISLAIVASMCKGKGFGEPCSVKKLLKRETGKPMTIPNKHFFAKD